MERIRKRGGTVSGFLVSRKLIIILLITFILLSILGTIIPQESLYPRDDFQKWQTEHPLLSKLTISLGLTHLYSSLGYITIVGVIFLSVFICTYKRALRAFKDRRRKVSEVGDFKKNENFTSFNCQFSIDESLKTVCAALSNKGYRVSHTRQEKGFQVEGEKGRCGVLGSLIFHLSFLILLVGAIASTWMRFEGKFILTEGQPFKGHLDEYISVKKAFLPTKPLNFRLVLQKFKPIYDTPPRYVSEVLIEDDSGGKTYETVRDFHALSYRGYTLYQKDHGFSPSFVLKDQRGKVIFNSFVAFKSHKEAEEVRYEDYFKIPGTSLEIEGRLYPDMVDNDGQLKTKSILPNNPVIAVKVKESGKEVFKSTIALHRNVQIGEHVFSFDDLRYWSGFRVVKDPGIPIIYLGFITSIFGLLVRILSVHEQIWIVIAGNGGNTSVIIAGSAEKGNAFFAKRFARMVEVIKGV